MDDTEAKGDILVGADGATALLVNASFIISKRSKRSSLRLCQCFRKYQVLPFMRRYRVPTLIGTTCTKK
jgi:hypothetical protein